MLLKILNKEAKRFDESHKVYKTRKVQDMKKFIALIFSILALTALVSCDKAESDIPEGMQLVYGSESDGYFFYAPEEWSISNTDNIKAAYISKLNTTSVSFAEVKFDTPGDKSQYFFEQYFNDHIYDLQKMKGFTLEVNANAVKFGIGEFAATKAVQYVYGYEYLEFQFKFMQILVEHDSHFYIFTYAGQSTADEGEEPNYTKYLSVAQSVIDNFRFVKRSAAESDSLTDNPRDEDGYVLVSNKKLAHFDLYVPESFKPTASSAIVTVRHDDGSTISISKAAPTGIDASQYFEARKKELEQFFEDVTVIQKDVDTELGNSDSLIFRNWDWAYEYTYVHEGKKHHVYQILSIDGFAGYVFTYTALEENYLTHFSEILKVIEKVRF